MGTPRREAPSAGAHGRRCQSCGAALRWANIPGAQETRWFAICSCGMPAAYFPLRPDYEPGDAIAAALGPARAAVRPPWVRIFQLTCGYPWWLPWRHVPRTCGRCRQRVTFAVWTRMPGGRSAYSALCLACGRATSEYLWPQDCQEVPGRLDALLGRAWGVAGMPQVSIAQASFGSGSGGGGI